MKLTAFVSTAAALLFAAGVAFAQADSTPSPAAGAATAPKARSDKSFECSKEADAKGVLGHKRRSAFIRACRKGDDTSKI
jgi:hypothetical protein